MLFPVQVWQRIAFADGVGRRRLLDGPSALRADAMLYTTDGTFAESTQAADGNWPEPLRGRLCDEMMTGSERLARPIALIPVE